MADSNAAPAHPAAGSSSNRPLSFSGAVQAVERVLSLRSSTSASQKEPAPEPLAGPFKADRIALNRKDLLSDSFPRISEERLESLFPGKHGEHTRNAVRAAIDEMDLAFRLDPKALGERTDANQGYLAIALLLSRLQLVAPSQLNASRPPGADVESDAANSGTAQRNKGSLAPPHRFETHDVLKAIDRRDVDALLAIRDANFDLLLDLSGGGAANSPAAAQAGGSTNTPLGYAISLGKGWEGVSIVLVGALSKFVNTLPDEDEGIELDTRTLARLRKVRVNLKLAMDHSIATDQTRLLASYLQVLVMSEGTSFLLHAIADVQHALASRSSDPVNQARTAVLQFITDGLRHKSDRVAAVRDYVDNATGDLILMAVWDLIKLPTGKAHESSLTEPLPLYFFARDERVTSHFIERVEALRDTPTRHTGVAKIARQLASNLQEGTRRKTSRERLEIIKTRLAK